jgi:predicted metalloendopeptidase
MTKRLPIALTFVIVIVLQMPMISAAASKTVPSTAELSSGIETKNVDKSVRPQDDLYRFVNNGWLKNTPIPADKSNYGAFTILFDQSLDRLKQIADEASAAKAAQGTETRKVGDFYNSYVDTARLETLGMKPIEGYLKEVDNIQDKNGLAQWFAKSQHIGINGPVRFFVNQDKKDVTQYIGYFFQSGLGLPDRDSYFKDDDKSKEIRAAYLKHIETMFGLAGFDDPAGSAQKIYALEEQLAKGQWTRVENRDPQKTYNKVEINNLNSLTADYDWKNFVDGLGIGKQSAVVVAQPTYIAAFGQALKNASLEDWKLYAKWRVLSDAAPYLSKKFDDESFNFNSKVLRGIQEQEPRWKRAVENIDGLMGEAVGKIYVEKYFPAEDKARMEKLVRNLLAAYKESIESLDWMSPETKKAAEEKLAKFTYKIGYPDKWRDYSSLQIKADDLVGNVTRAVEFEYNRDLNKLGKPIDRTEWGMTPQTVNAYYNPLMNEIVFPAAILQPPFFNKNTDDAANYGGIGAVIGHEIGHGFDDSGSQYDGDGNLRSWWTEQDRKEFDARTAKLVAQYEAFTPVPGEHVNGKLTLGENIGDLGGLSIAYKAYKLSLNGKEPPVIDGFTADQRFFMGWAQVWARLYRDEELRQRLVTDPHSPSEYRCNGVVRNVPQFYTAFDVKESDKLYLKPEERVKIW